jgi:hypothetical protein
VESAAWCDREGCPGVVMSKSQRKLSNLFGVSLTGPKVDKAFPQKVRGRWPARPRSTPLENTRAVRREFAIEPSEYSSALAHIKQSTCLGQFQSHRTTARWQWSSIDWRRGRHRELSADARSVGLSLASSRAEVEQAPSPNALAISRALSTADESVSGASSLPLEAPGVDSQHGVDSMRRTVTTMAPSRRTDR